MKKNEITQHLVDLNELEILDLVRKELEGGADPLEVLDACREGMIIVGKRFEAGEYYLPELIMAGEIFSEVSEILRSVIKEGSAETKGTVVFGTVRGDVHDIGKDIIVGILRGVGYRVHDLGTNVETEQFVKKMQETGAPILGLSGLITTAYNSMREVIEALDKAGIRKRVKVMIGGGVTDERVRVHTGADAYGNDPTDALKLCAQFMGGN
ncbi:MAG: cobalamin-dependent protein [Candidatus Aminicenantes bacterium]|nr:cobalamin-dependent protein [Candidatus Aminicenantes bacterium]